MDTYIYLLLGIAVFLPLVVVLLRRADIRGKLLKIGCIGGVAGLVAEFFYFRDYWRPPSILGIATISIEDFLFGFAITALSFCAYMYIARTSYGKQHYPQQRKLYAAFFVIGLAAMCIGNVYFGINSIFVTSALFVVFSGIVLMKRRDLLVVGTVSTAVVLLYILAIYLVLFNIVAPEFWNNYWLLADTPLGITVLGNIPLTEIIWYASWIWFASISYPFVSGKGIRR